MKTITFSKIDLAMFTAMSKAIWLAPLQHKLTLTADDTEGLTMATDGVNLIINPKFVEEIGRDLASSVIVHELWHVALMHPLRRKDRDPHVWNIACDMEVNALCQRMNLNLPSDSIPAAVGGIGAEEIYLDIMKQAKPMKQKDQADKKSGEAGSKDQEQKQGPSPTPHQKQKDRVAQVAGIPEKYKTPHELPKWGRFIDQPNEKMEKMNKEEKEEAEKNIKQQTKEGMMLCGNLPEWLKRTISKIVEPILDWKHILNQFIGDLSKKQNDWSRPNKRFIPMPLIMPTQRGGAIGKVILAADTSGSINEPALTKICSELFGAIETYEEEEQTELVILWCDTEVTEQIATSSDKLKPVGGGGTDFAPVFAWIKQKHQDAVATVYITDGLCKTFGEDPNHPVLWILTPTNKRFQPPFGQTMQLEEAQ